MDKLMIILMLICLISLVIGLLKPELVIRWGDENKKTRKSVFKYYGLGMLICFIMVGVMGTTENPDTQNNYSNTAEDLSEKDETDQEEKDEIITDKFKLQYGELLEYHETEDILVIKAKIESNISKKLTVSQNGFNVEDLILNQEAEKYNEIQYWAVADMADGTESKVVSFTVDKDLIFKVKNKKVYGNEIITHSKDVWIHKSLSE